MIDYFLQEGIKVTEMRAKRESLADLIAGKDVEFKTMGEFSVVTEASAGYLTSKDSKALTAAQREQIYNLVYILSMQRTPIKKPKSAVTNPAKSSLVTNGIGMCFF